MTTHNKEENHLLGNGRKTKDQHGISGKSGLLERVLLVCTDHDSVFVLRWWTKEVSNERRMLK